MSCKKKCYKSRSIAKARLKKINKTGRKYNLKNVYYCDECLNWHTTSIKRSDFRGNKMEQTVSKESSMWIMSLACAQVILENQGELENSNKYKRKLKQATKTFIGEIEKSMVGDINAIFDQDEQTSQLILKAVEKLSKVAAKLNPTHLDKLIEVIEENNLLI